jgi:hypothetical protein
MCRFPQGADLLFLLPRCEDALLQTQLKKVLHAFSFRIVASSLPLADGAAGGPKPLGQARLRQTNAGA